MTTFRTRIPNHFDLPPCISRLGELAYNLWWTWNPTAQRLFNRMDNALWERTNHNPLRFLREVDRSEMNTAVSSSLYQDLYDQVCTDYDAYLGREDTWFSNIYHGQHNPLIAYFSMEYGLHETLPIYSGGMGVLAGDYLKEASDMGLPLVGVGFLYREGYFFQRISEDGWQEAVNNPLSFDELPVLPVLTADGKPMSVKVAFPDRRIMLQLWEVRVGRVPLYLMDANVNENELADRPLTNRLYFSDLDLRVMQEVLLGVGGVRALHALGHNPTIWHMNEGHAAFLTLERVRELVAAKGRSTKQAIAQTCPSNIFTTHTPVPAGNDEFPLWLVDKYLSNLWPELKLTRDQFVDLACHRQSWGETFSMPVLALRLSQGRNAVSELHGRVARRMWNFLWPEIPEADVPISSITNGVHTPTWMARRLRVLFDHYLGKDWLDHLDAPETWEKIDTVPDQVLWAVRNHLKRKLAFHIMERTRQRWLQGGFHPVQVVASGVMLDPYVLTIGFARRFATYKRANLILSDVGRLLEIINHPNRPVQIIFAGKAHPADDPAKSLIQEVYRAVKKAENGGRMVFLEDYDMNLARYLVQGVDVWLNTPRPPNEACGTSGMKAALNGVLNCSVLDGWWREAYNGENGWAIGEDADLESSADDRQDAESLYNLLEKQIVPLYYADRGVDDIPHAWVARVKESLRTITPLFSTRRMLKEYLEKQYLPAMK